MIIALHFFYSYTRTVKLLCSLLLNFFYLSLKIFMFILCKHIPEFIFKVLWIIWIFFYLKTVSKGQIRSRLCDFIGLENIRIRILLVSFDNTKVFGHFFHIDRYSFVINNLLMNWDNVTSLTWKFDLIIIVCK